MGEGEMETKMIEFRGHFATPSQEPSRGGFGEGSGWIWGGFWESFRGIPDDFGMIFSEMLEGFRLNVRRRVSGGFWMDLGRILGGFWMDLGMFLRGFSMNFGKVFV